MFAKPDGDQGLCEHVGGFASTAAQIGEEIEFRQVARRVHQWGRACAGANGDTSVINDNKKSFP